MIGLFYKIAISVTNTKNVNRLISTKYHFYIKIPKTFSKRNSVQILRDSDYT